MRHFHRDGGILRTCFHCAFPGYSGGLVIGNFNASGMAYYPPFPIRGFRSINVFCAQDESLWDRSENAEYAYGWSENFGRGDDGKTLAYLQGRIVEDGPERVILQSENAGGCYRVTKVAASRADASWWILATRISNRCDREVRFDFFTGDDPWIGLYRSSEGDVGWTPEGILQRETELDPFLVGGLYDVGNPDLGETSASFSNQANFVAIDPASPLPDRAFLANRFAHHRRDIDAKRVLDNKTMTALNLGWTDVRLAPGAGFVVATAWGLAQTGRPGDVPTVPAVSDDDWSMWRGLLKADASAGGQIQFASEDVTLDLRPPVLVVGGQYHLLNPTDDVVGLTVDYPIAASTLQPPPTGEVLVDGRAFPLVRLRSKHWGVTFPVSVGPRRLMRFDVSYRQMVYGSEAVYMVTSARTWPTPIARAVFRIRHPSSLGHARVSFPVSTVRQTSDGVELLVVRRSFRPDKELVVTWERRAVPDRRAGGQRF